MGSVTRSNVAELLRQRTVLRQIVARSHSRLCKLCTGRPSAVQRSRCLRGDLFLAQPIHEPVVLDRRFERFIHLRILEVASETLPDLGLSSQRIPLARYRLNYTYKFFRCNMTTLMLGIPTKLARKGRKIGLASVNAQRHASRSGAC